MPAFGSDFWSQPEYAARVWVLGLDPYATHDHLFHYPPLVIRLFLWVPYLAPLTALRVWVVANIVVVVAGTVVAHRLRPRLGLSQSSLLFVLPLVLFSFPVIFELERSNFDLICLFVLLLALPLLERRTLASELAAGALLAVAPWVKLYPGVIGLGLLALRRTRVFVGFVLAGVAIGLSTPQETRDSFHVLGLAIERVTRLAQAQPLADWTHSLSTAWIRLGIAAPKGLLRTVVTATPGSAVAGLVVIGTLLPVCYRVFRSRNTAALTYPLLLWMMSVASAAPIIANDYSLTFLTLAALAVWSLREPWYLQATMLVTLVAYQPFRLPIPPPLLLALKLLSLVVVGAAIARRARDLDATPTAGSTPARDPGA